MISFPFARILCPFRLMWPSLQTYMGAQNRDTVRRFVFKKWGDIQEIDYIVPLHIEIGLHCCRCLQLACTFSIIKSPSISIKLMMCWALSSPTNSFISSLQQTYEQHSFISPLRLSWRQIAQPSKCLTARKWQTWSSCPGWLGCRFCSLPAPPKRCILSMVLRDADGSRLLFCVVLIPGLCICLSFGI